MRPLILNLACVILTCGVLAPIAQSQDSSRPNILFFFTDDHSTAAIGAYGSVINETPNLDRLSEQGMRFERAFCTNAICAPSRAVILTGKHSHINGVIDNGKHFDGSQTTFPKLLQSVGYETAIIGKWHLKTDPTGFDYWEILPGQGQYYNPDFRTADGSVRHEGHSTEITADLALQWLNDARDGDKPFLLMCQFKAPHRPWLPSPEHVDLYEGEQIPEPETLFDDYATRTRAAHEQEMSIANHMNLHYDLKCWPVDLDFENLDAAPNWARGRYRRMNDEQRENWIAAYRPRNEWFHDAALEGDDLVRWKYQRYIKDYLRCIAGVDEQIGRILEYLDENDLSENTIVVYSSDQGFFLGEHGWYDKRFMYEPALRMPFIVRWPGVTNPGSVDAAHLVQNLDFAETFLDAAGVAIPEDMQGRSLVPLLKGESPPDWRDSIYYEYFEKGTHNVAPHYGVRTDRYKLIHFHEYDGWEFYDLETDPDEINNRYDDEEYATIIENLKSELHRLREHYEAN